MHWIAAPTTTTTAEEQETTTSTVEEWTTTVTGASSGSAPTTLVAEEVTTNATSKPLSNGKVNPHLTFSPPMLIARKYPAWAPPPDKSAWIKTTQQMNNTRLR